MAGPDRIQGRLDLDVIGRGGALVQSHVLGWYGNNAQLPLRIEESYGMVPGVGIEPTGPVKDGGI
jgi:hypothetical protein